MTALDRLMRWRAKGHGALVLVGLLSAVAVAALIATTSLNLKGTVAYADPGWDRHMYVYMAETNPLDFHLAPYSYRVLVPAIVWLSPFGVQATFLGVAALAVWGTGVLLYLFFRGRGHPGVLAAAGVMFFFALGWASRYQLRDFWIPDAVAFLAVAAALVAVVQRRPWLFAACLLVGVLAKESVIFVGPLYYTLNTVRLVERRLALQMVVAVAPAALALVALRLAIPAYNADVAYISTLPRVISDFPEIFPRYNYVSLALQVGYERRWVLRDVAPEDYVLGPFALPLLLLAAVGLWRNWRLGVRLLPFMVLVYAQVVVATDTQRLLVLGAPAVILLALKGMAHICASTPFRPVHFLALAVAQFALLIGGEDHGVQLAHEAALVLGWLFAAGAAVALGPTAARVWSRATGRTALPAEGAPTGRG